MLSSDIIPYTTCLDGLREALADYSLKRINIEGNLDRGRNALKEMNNKPPSFLVAVGPRAAYLVSEQNYPFPRFFCMVLNPDNVLGAEKLFPGVSLNIPPDFQLQNIKKAFPQREKIGVFFSPKYNQALIESLQQEAKKLGLSLTVFSVSSPSEIPDKIKSEKFFIDVLLIIPDEQLRSIKILEYIIKESLQRKIPVVGYNRWFASNGAILSLIIDYRDVGLQTGRIVKKFLPAGHGPAGVALIESPVSVKISVDLKTARKLGIQVSPVMIKIADEVNR